MDNDNTTPASPAPQPASSETNALSARDDLDRALDATRVQVVDTPRSPLTTMPNDNATDAPITLDRETEIPNTIRDILGIIEGNREVARAGATEMEVIEWPPVEPTLAGETAPVPGVTSAHSH